MHLPVTSADFGNVCHYFVVDGVFERYYYYRHVFVYECYRTVFHFGGRVTLGVDI